MEVYQLIHIKQVSTMSELLKDQHEEVFFLKINMKMFFSRYVGKETRKSPFSDSLNNSLNYQNTLFHTTTL